MEENNQTPQEETNLTPKEENIESFIPTDYFKDEEGGKKAQNPAVKKKHRIGTGGIAAICAAALLLIIAGGLTLYITNLKNNPASLFEMSTQATATPDTAALTVEATPEPGAPEASEEPQPTDTPELSDEEQLAAIADTSMMQNIVNICLIGVDYAEERESGYGGKAADNAFHADVIIVLAINFDENKVDMISIPRDTYAKIPGVKGIYKINAALDCGGGLFAEDGAGFKKVCEAASWMLGDIPVNYYYAVTMPAVKQLGDAIGGVDFDVDIDFTIQGRSYKKGYQHLDGQGILDYFRVRKNISASGDNNRVKRQKNLLLAIFNKLKSANMLAKIPEILSSFDGMMYTNTTTSQTAALALFGMSLDSDNVKMHSMGSGSNGTSGVTNIFNWNFCLTDQKNRVEIIKEVYGVDKPQYKEYTRTYAWYRWYSMLSPVYLETAEELADYVADKIAADDLLPEATEEPEETLTPTDIPIEVTPTATPEPTATSAPTAIPEPTETPEPTATATPNKESNPAPAAEEPEESSEDNTPNGDAGESGEALSIEYMSARYPLADGETRKYDDAARQQYYDFLDAIEQLKDAMEASDTQASKYLNGKSSSLSDANETLGSKMDKVKSLATSLASTFGYKGTLKWTYRYEYMRSFNEIQVNFN